jgi:hypothetical protein
MQITSRPIEIYFQCVSYNIISNKNKYATIANTRRLTRTYFIHKN